MEYRNKHENVATDTKLKLHVCFGEFVPQNLIELDQSWSENKHIPHWTMMQLITKINLEL